PGVGGGGGEGLAAAAAVAEAEPPTPSTRPALMGGPATGAIPVAGWEAVSGRRDARPAPARTGADVCARLRRERALPRTRLRRGAPLDRDSRVHSAKRATVGRPRAAPPPRDRRVGATAPASRPDLRRSEERRVGKERRSRQ